MTFSRLAPTSGWIVLAIVLAAVVALYFLKPPPQPRVVPSLMIWESLSKRRSRRSALWRWLLSLIVSALIALGLAAALTGLRPSAAELDRPLFVVDASPTMAALRSDGRSRWQHALDAVRELAPSASGPMAVTDTNGRPLLRAASGDELARQLSDWPQRPPATLRGSGRVLPFLPGGDQPERRIVLITDGVTAWDLPPETRVRSVFEPASNLSLSALEIRPAADAASAFVEVRHAGTESIRAVVRVLRRTSNPAAETEVPPEDQVLAEQELELAAQERWSARITLPADARSGTLIARVSSADGGNDAYPDDDQRTVAFGAAHLRVYTDAAADSDLARLLRADPRVETVTRRSAAGLRLNRALADVAVLTRSRPNRRPAIPTVLFGADAVDWLPPAGPQLEDLRPSSINWLGGVSLDDVQISSSFSWPEDLPEGTRALTLPAEGDASPDTEASRPIVGLDAAGADLDARVLAFGFELDDSNLTRLPAFPVWLDQTLVDLVSTAVGSDDGDAAATGQPLPPINAQALDAAAAIPLEAASGLPRVRPQSWLALVALLLLVEPLLRRRGWTE